MSTKKEKEEILKAKIERRKKISKVMHRTVSDQDCPKCDFPEIILVRDKKTMRPLWVECSDVDCDWGKKIISRRN